MPASGTISRVIRDRRPGARVALDRPGLPLDARDAEPGRGAAASTISGSRSGQG